MKAENKRRLCGTHQQKRNLYKIFVYNLGDNTYIYTYGVKLAQDRVE